ncbi:hypothetical protein [Sphingopyxis yananensis]|uniref:hypothetical protein n=1 Tax=Sphingopyxis yananensis TaxID=2886687 RepID=UPI001D12624E|nr:hypothetical protein [Sphingopyxis yananensis]MCC2603674.1 hypothetical protein [Sphingopyxis yananensis]
MRRIITFLGQKAALYLLLVVVIGLATITVPWVQEIWAGARQAEQRQTALQQADQILRREAGSAAAAFRTQAGPLRQQSLTELDAQKTRLLAERADLQKQMDRARPAWVLAISDQQALLDGQRRKLRAAMIDQQVAAIDAARAAVDSDGRSILAQQNVAAQRQALAQQQQLCSAAAQRLQDYEARWHWRWRQWIESADHRALVAQKAQSCAARDQAQRAVQRFQAAARYQQQAQQAADSAFASAAQTTQKIDAAGRDLAADAAKAAVILSGSVPEKLRLWAAQIGLASLMWKAAAALLVIMMTPLILRLFLYYILAPIAMRRPYIRLHIPAAMGQAIAPSLPSVTSLAVRLGAGQELLVRQDYLQSSSHASSKSTRWFLDWRRPLVSLVSGLSFLTCLRGDGEMTNVSAINDGFAEVTSLNLNEGAACVLQPRALAAVVQPIGRPVRITSHWRLLSLNAWLTMQLRYLVFHGPARLILKGGRGVRVEMAEQGRIFGQDQLVGFSADLSYSVTRTETFWPYFLGREPLLKDRVLAGQGVLIVEEAPKTRRDAHERRGLEGMLDALLKLFGL